MPDYPELGAEPVAIRCPACGALLRSLVRYPRAGPAAPIHFVPYHQYGWPKSSGRRVLVTCHRTMTPVKASEAERPPAEGPA